MHLNPLSPILRSRVGRIAWSLVRHPARCLDFPAEHERLITADELLRYGFSGISAR